MLFCIKMNYDKQFIDMTSNGYAREQSSLAGVDNICSDNRVLWSGQSNTVIRCPDGQYLSVRSESRHIVPVTTDDDGRRSAAKPSGLDLAVVPRTSQKVHDYARNLTILVTGRK